jgi:hypothetical protein
MSIFLHPDTMSPIETHNDENLAGHLRTAGGWAIGFLLADGGMISRITPNTPADRASLVHESEMGLFKGKCVVGDQVPAPNSEHTY